MPLRACTVTFQDPRGIRHGVEVEAESLYEAVVLAVKPFREDPWLPSGGHCARTRFLYVHPWCSGRARDESPTLNGTPRNSWHSTAPLRDSGG